MILYMIEFVIISILFYVNINSIVQIVFGPNTHRVLVKYIYFAVALAYIPVKMLCNSQMRLMLLIVYYGLLFFALLIHKPSILRNNIIYISILFLMVDSLFRSVTYLFVGSALKNCKKELIVWTSSIIFNLIVLLLLRRLKKHNLTLLKSGIHIINNKIYVLALISLIIASGLLENQVSVTENIELQNILTKILTVVSISLLVFIMFMLVITCISKNYFENVSKLLETQVKSQVKYYTKMDKLNSSLREFRHDYKNHMTCVKMLLEKHQYEDAEKYISGINQMVVSDLNRYNTGNKVADAILTDKFELASKADVQLDFDGTIHPNISSIDLCIILSNAIDNAIEACIKLPDEVIRTVKIECACVQNVQLIRISNPTDNVMFVNDTEICTTKDNKELHGFGLYNIKKTVAKHSGDFSIKVDDGQFILEVGFRI